MIGSSAGIPRACGGQVLEGVVGKGSGKAVEGQWKVGERQWKVK